VYAGGGGVMRRSDIDGRGYKEASIALVSDPKFLQAHIENEHPFGICSTKIAA